MTFQATFEKHLKAIRERDLAALRETLPAEEGEIVVVTSDGRLVRSTEEFLDMHRQWFESSTWSINGEVISIRESHDLAIAVLKLDYFDRPADKPPLHETSYLTLAFAERTGRWEMIFDQNTPCKYLGAGA
jgi:uncharacterized protein (TIGR02246 family)